MTTSSRTRWALLLLALALGVNAGGNRKCYYPDGSESRNDVPCSDVDGSACCGSGSICMSNGYCLDQSQPFGLSRGSCTDKGWESSNCPQQCNTCFEDGGCAVVAQTLSADSTEYCCGSVVVTDGNLACSCGSSFTLDDGEIIAGRAALASLSSTAAASATSAAETSATETSSSSSESNGKAADSAESSTTSDNTKSTSHDVAVGAGVGVPLGLAAIGFLTWALWERRGKKQLQQSMLQHGWTFPGQGQNGGYFAAAQPAVELPGDRKPGELSS